MNDDDYDVVSSRVWKGITLTPYTVDMDDVYAENSRCGRYMISEKKWLSLPFASEETSL